MPSFLRNMLLFLCMSVCLHWLQPSLIIAGEAAAAPEKDKNKSPAPAEEEKKKKAGAGQKQNKPSPLKADASASYLWEVCPIVSSNGAEIERLIGNPTPFTVKARDARTLLIYTSRIKLSSDDKAILQRVHADIKALSESPSTPSTSEVLEVPHARALGDLAARAKQLNYPGITVEAARFASMKVKKQRSHVSREPRIRRTICGALRFASSTCGRCSAWARGTRTRRAPI